MNLAACITHCYLWLHMAPREKKTFGPFQQNSKTLLPFDNHSPLFSSFSCWTNRCKKPVQLRVWQWCSCTIWVTCHIFVRLIQIYVLHLIVNKKRKRRSKGIWNLETDADQLTLKCMRPCPSPTRYLKGTPCFTSQHKTIKWSEPVAKKMWHSFLRCTWHTICFILSSSSSFLLVFTNGMCSTFHSTYLDA